MAIDLKKLVGETAVTHLIEKIKALNDALEAKIAAKSDFDGQYSSLTGAPESLKNPHTLTFSGASSETYDGSEEVTVDIPEAEHYTLPQATAEALGGIKADEKTTESVEAKIDAETGKLYVPAPKTYADATGSSSGLMPSTDKAKLDKFADADEYAKKTDIASVYRFKETLETDADLTEKEEGAQVGDVYNITTSAKYGNGANVAWDGTAWDALGGIADLTAYAKTADFAEMSNEAVDSVWQSVFSPEA